MATTEDAVQYVYETADGGWRVVGSRVSLDSVVYAYWAGKSPEAIAEEFPSLAAEQVYGAIAYYLRIKDEIDNYLSQQDGKWDQLQTASEAANGPLLNRLRGGRKPTAGEVTP